MPWRVPQVCSRSCSELKHDMAAAETSGVCTAASGWALSGIGTNCTYVGSNSWADQQLMVGSCARNVRKALDGHSRAWITSLLDKAHGGALIFEDAQRSGDPDGTRAALRAWAAADPRVRLLLAAPLLYPKWSRTQRLALCRNMLAQEAVRALPESGALVALDLDCHAPAAESIMIALSSMNTQRRWDVLTANTRQPMYYYDRWALRSGTLGLVYDCWFNKSQARLHGGCLDYAIQVDPAAQPFAVESAFNGLGLYRAAALRIASDCRYRGTKNSYLCEHVPFHLCMRAHQLAIGVLPSLATDCGPTELSPPQKLKIIRYGVDGRVQVASPAASVVGNGVRMASERRVGAGVRHKGNGKG